MPPGIYKVPEPTRSGQEIVEEAQESGIGWRRATVASKVEDIASRAGDVAKFNQKAMSRPKPTGAHVASRVPAIDQAPRDFPTEHILTSAIVTLFVVPQAIRWAVTRVRARRRKARSDESRD